MNDLFLPLPKSNTQEILYTLIKQGHVSIMDYPYLSGFRTRVSELNRLKGLKTIPVKEQRHNKFGNPFKYVIHMLPESEKEKALSIYKRLSK